MEVELSESRIFNPLKRKVLRKNISRTEARIGASVVVVLILAGLWILTQRDNFDPGDRDISIEVLIQQSVRDDLYKPKLKTWVEPGSLQAASGAPELDIFPVEVLDNGWSLDGRVEIYDPSNVYEKINGAAEQYIKFGFASLHYLSIENGDDLISIEIYDQGDFANTLGIFAAQRASSREVLSLGNMFYYTTPVGAVGGFEKYYFKFSGNSESEGILAKTGALIEMMKDLPVEKSSSPRGYTTMLNDLNIPFDRIAYEKNDAFQYDFADDFWFGSMGDGDEFRIYVHEALDIAAAQSLYTQLVEEQSFEYNVLESGQTKTLFQHEFLETLFAVEIKGSIIFGVDGAENRTTTEKWLNTLRKAVSDE